MRRSSLLAAAASVGVLCLLGLLPEPSARAQTTTHAGKPITTEPCPAPDDAQKKIKLPDGFEVRLFAAEPDVVNPVAMTWDTRGRLWVLELYEYPRGAAKGAKPRDRIVVLEDTDGDGRADQRTVWYEGLNLACGLVYGNYRGQPGVYVGQAPQLLFIPQNDDGTAGSPKVLRGGFGLHDTHELVNGFNWGPDGRLYMTHGVFTKSYVRDPDDPNDDGVRVDAAVARLDPVSNKFEIFADGMSNQWGVDFNGEGQAFVSACVIDHLFHVAPGGIYVRQAGTPGFAYSYELLRSIVKHKHQKAAYCGIVTIQNGHWPADYQQTLLMGNIHGHCINRDRPNLRGSSYFATDAGDFLTANDGWFMPTSLQFGPDGELWVSDWCDRYPCYQNAQADPAGVDRSRGRIWRVVYVGDQPGKPVRPVPANMGDLARRPVTELVELLSSPSVWHRRQASRLLVDRPDGLSVAASIRHVADDGRDPIARRAAVWTWYAMSFPQGKRASPEAFVADRDPVIRAWVARVIGERREVGEPEAKWLTALAADADPVVRRETAHAARRLAGKLDTAAVILALLRHRDTPTDPMLPFFVWMAAEPVVADSGANPAGSAKPLLEELAKLDPVQAPGAADLVRRAMRRLADTNSPERLSEAVAFLSALKPQTQAVLAAAALDGLLEGMKGKKIRPAGELGDALSRWQTVADHGVSEKARRLGAIWGDASAAAALLAALHKPDAPEADRLAGIRTARQLKGELSRAALLAALKTETRPALLAELLPAIGDVGGDATVAAAVLARWRELPTELRRTAAETLATRPAWGLALIAAVEAKTVERADVPLPAVRTLASSDDAAVRDRAAAVLGRYKPVGEQVAKLIAAKRAAVINGPVDWELGRAMAAKHCLTCHQLHGVGAATLVGPDLTGVGRSSLDALLANVLNPNEVIGKGYENVIVRTTDERVVAGRLIEDTATHVKLLAAGPKEEIVAKADIDAMKVTDLSVMPEGLEKQMTDAEFRSLIWYVLAHPADADKRVRVSLGDKQLTVLARLPGPDGQPTGEWHPLLSYATDPALRPYLHPVRDPSGQHILTDDKPSDHPWQHGVFTGLHRVGSANLDFWSEKTGKQRFVRLLDVQQAADKVSWRSLTEWVAPTGEVVLLEEQTVTVYAPTSAEQYVVDFDWTLRSSGAAVPIGRYDYGGLSVRLKLHPQHSHLNSLGTTGKKTATQAAAWCDVSRPFDEAGQSILAGITVLDHVSNPTFPSKWRVDGQGMISPSPSLSGDWGLRAKEERTLRYRLVVHRGGPDAATLEAEHRKFSAGATPASAAAGAAAPAGVPTEVAAWNRDWTVTNPAFEGTPRVDRYLGREGVLCTHPLEDRRTPATLERTVAVPAGRKATLSFAVAGHERGDWELRVLADGESLHREVVGPASRGWQTVRVDLSRFAGKSVKLTLANAPGGKQPWAWEFGYWSDVRLEIAD